MKIKCYVTLLIAYLALALPAIAQQKLSGSMNSAIYLNCFTGQGGPIASISIFWNHIKVLPSSKGFYFWRDDVGGGYFQDGGNWILASAMAGSNLSVSGYKAIITDKIYGVHVENALITSGKTVEVWDLEVERISGRMSSTLYFPTIGESSSSQATCDRAKDPATIPAPAAKF